MPRHAAGMIGSCAVGFLAATAAHLHASQQPTLYEATASVPAMDFTDCMSKDALPIYEMATIKITSEELRILRRGSGATIATYRKMPGTGGRYCKAF
jgi:hypothetical protein